MSALEELVQHVVDLKAGNATLTAESVEKLAAAVDALDKRVGALEEDIHDTKLPADAKESPE